MLVNYVNPSREQLFDIQDGGISFYNDDNDDSKLRPGRARGQGLGGCGKGGRQHQHGHGHYMRVHMKHTQSVIRNRTMRNT
jgi:hypothetical protein